MNRNELLKRHQAQQSRRSSSGIPGWLWGIAIGALGAFVAIGVVIGPNLPPGNSPALTANETQSPQPPVVREVEPEVQRPTEIAIVATNEPLNELQDQSERQNEEIERLRQGMDDLRRQGNNERAPEPKSALRSPVPQEDEKDSRQSALEREAQSEAEWRPIFSEFQKRYREKQTELDDTIRLLERTKAQCEYTQMGEPTVAQKNRGVKQEGLPASLVMGGTVEYGSSCETVDNELKQVKQDKFEALRQIQDDCYKEAMARGVSTARAKLR